MKIVSDFISHAKNMPKHPAVVERNKVTTYGDMLEIANRVSNYLTKNFARPRVVIDLPQSADAYAVMFGVLMSGGCYSPLNFDAPHYRKKLIVERFKPDIVICHNIEECTAEIDLNYVSLESIPLTNGIVPNYENGPAYVMFTSGSTGIPKGVSIPRSALDHYIQWAVSTFEITPADRLSQHPNLGFDLSVLDIFMGLSSGATLYPLTTTADRIFPVKFIHENQLTVWNSVPSVIDLFNKMPNVTSSHLSSLRLLSFCGEPLLARHLDALFCLAPDAAVQNTYGPTEATVSCTHVAMDRSNYKDFCHGEKVSLGAPIGEMSIHLNNVDVNGVGEIVICGPQVASEYWNDGKKTKASFFERSRDKILERCYLTGDLGVYRGEYLFFTGRVDDQIKINGHRVELGDIETCVTKILRLPACAISIEQKIFCFVETNERVDTVALFSTLAEILPNYSIPHHIENIKIFPRNVNGKIDKNALMQIMKKKGDEW